MKIIKGLTTVFISLFIAGASNALTAYEIMKKVDERDTGKTQVSKATMVLIDKKDRKRVRKLQLFSKSL